MIGKVNRHGRPAHSIHPGLSLHGGRDNQLGGQECAQPYIHILGYRLPRLFRVSTYNVVPDGRGCTDRCISADSHLTHHA
jgi:hypothetical protein